MFNIRHILNTDKIDKSILLIGFDKKQINKNKINYECKNFSQRTNELSLRKFY